MGEAESHSYYSSSSSCWLKSKARMKDYGFMTESEMDAAQNLMQLSDEEEKSNKRRRRNYEDEDEDEEEEVNQRLHDSIMAKIQEIFGKDIEGFRTKKQKRYRSLVNIYMATTPVNAGGYDTRVVKASEVREIEGKCL